jgi:polyisoprenoid-binding protein YceI
LVRWQVQGSHNLYTALHKRFYVPDPDLGWRVSTQHPIWLGLDVCAVIVAVAVGIVIGAFIIRRRERARDPRATSDSLGAPASPRRATALRAVSWIVAALTLAIPTAAFASGPGPLHGVDSLPPSSAVLIESGIEGSLDAPPGRYAVVEHAGTSITAHLSAGGEAFDARFDHDITGTWLANPRDLRAAMRAEISVAAAAVDTGVGERTKHAREGYLHADEFPRITIALDHPDAVRADGAGKLAFRAPATVQLMGKTHAVQVTGTLAKPDAAALARLGLSGDVLLVQADFALATHETALAPNAGDFDGDRLPIHVSLVLRRSP